VWRWLRDRRFREFKFRRQYPIGPFVLDFYSPLIKLAIELDGAPHLEAERRLHDAKRTRYLAKHGITVLRFWNQDVREQPDSVADVIEATCDALLAV